jgi:hypothetical protein
MNVLINMTSSLQIPRKSSFLVNIRLIPAFPHKRWNMKVVWKGFSGSSIDVSFVFVEAGGLVGDLSCFIMIWEFEVVADLSFFVVFWESEEFNSLINSQFSVL